MGEENDLMSLEKNSHSHSSSVCDSSEYHETTSSIPTFLCEENGMCSVNDDDKDQELTYGPGIVDKLKSRFLSITMRESQMPRNKLRRYSSLENLLETDRGGHSSNFFSKKMNTPGNRDHGIVTSCRNNLKRAKSMETLLLENERCRSPFNGSLKPRDMRPLSFNGRVSPSVLVNDNVVIVESSITKEDNGEFPHGGKVVKRREVNRQLNVSITDEELPKPDTVKIYKRIFEPAEPKSAIQSNIRRRPPVIRASAKVASTVSKPGHFRKNAALSNTAQTKQMNGVSAKCSAKDAVVTMNGDSSEEAVTCLKDKDIAHLENGDFEVNQDKMEGVKNESSKLLEDGKSLRSVFNAIPKVTSSQNKLNSWNKSHGLVKKPDKVNTENTKIPVLVPQIEKEPTNSSSLETTANNTIAQDSDTVNSVVETSEGALNDKSLVLKNSVIEVVEDLSELENEDKTTSENNSEAQSFTDESDCEVLKPSTLLGNKKSLWQKPPSSTNTVVFDFRGKDVKPNISLNPAPFGCKPARVKKRSASAPFLDGKEKLPYQNTLLNGCALEDCLDDYDDDDMDTSANLSFHCSIIFEGENVKVGKGALLATRNKKLKIQFDDSATSTFEYPSETSLLEDPDTSTPAHNNGLPDTADSTLEDESVTFTKPAGLTSTPALGLTGGLASYTPSVLSTAESFQLGMSRPLQRDAAETPKQEIKAHEEILEDMLKPADPDDIYSWSSSTSSSDLLF